MGKVITTWVLDLAESKSGLQELVGVVETYNTTIAKAAQTAKQGFSEAAQSQVKANQQLAAGVQQQQAVTKAVEATTAAVVATTAAEGKLIGFTTEASDKAKAALDENIKRQRNLTTEINASAAAAERAKGGGIQMPAIVQPIASAAPVAPATALVGAVPSPSVLAVTQEFERQAAIAKDATIQAQKYLDTVTAGAVAAKTAAAAANQEAKEHKAVYNEDLADLKKLEREAVELRALLDKAAPGEQWLKANSNLERNIGLQNELNQAVREDKEAYEAANRAALAANTQLADQNNLQLQAKAIVREAAIAEKELAAAQKEAIAAANQEARATGLIGAAEDKLTALIQKRKQAQTVPAIQGIDKEIAKVKEEIDSYNKLSNSAPKQSGFASFFSGLAGQALAAGAAFFTVNKAVQLFTDGLKNAADLAGIKSSFNALAGSAEAGAAEFDYLDNKSKELGLDLISTANSYKLLFASAKEAGLGLEDTRKIFEAISSEGRVLGLSNQQVESSLLAVSQMLGKGTVSSQELKLQLGNALPDALAQASKALGVTTKELNKMLEKGQIISADFLPKFAAQIQKTYGGATADAAQQLQANLNRISNAYKSFTAGLASILTPAISFLANLVDSGDKQAKAADQATAAYERQSAAVSDLNKTIPALVTEYEALQKKGNLNNVEQERLKTLLEEITKAIPGASKGFDAYGKSLGLNTDAVAAFLKSNAALAENLRGISLRENKKLLDQLEAQQKAVIERLNNTKLVDGVARLQQYYGGQGGGQGGVAPLATQDESDKLSKVLFSENEKLLIRIAAIKARIAGTPLEGKDPAKTEKHFALILELQKKIADLTEKRSLVNNDAITATNPNGGGVPVINNYTAQIKKAQKELDDLLGKEGKKVADGRLAALKALLAEEEKLRKSHEKAVLDELKDSGQARAAEQLRQDFNEVAAAEKQIKALEKAYAKAGGKGVNADGKINADQQEQINNLRLLAVQKYNEEIARINREANAKILELQAESDEKELAQLRAKFDEEIRIAQVANDALGSRIERAAKAGNQVLVLSLAASKSVSDELLAALKAAATEQERLLVRQQELNNIDRTEKAQTNSVSVGLLPTVQFEDPTADGSGAEQAGAAKRVSLARSIYEKLFTLETDLEAKKQKALLQIQIDGNNARLAKYANDFTKEGIAIKDGLETTNKGLYDQLNAIKEPKREFNLAKLLGVAKEDQDEVNQAFGDFLSNVSEQLNTYLQEQVDATTKVVEARKADVEEKQKDLDTELALNKQGFASNVETKRQELAEAKSARAEALKEQKAALKAQQTVSTIEQTVSLISASAKILDGFSAIPIIGPALGIAAVAAMFGFFIAAKAKASAASAKLEKGGWIGGKRHSEGGNKFVSTDGQEMEHEAGEFAVNRKSANKYAAIIQALNADDEKLFADLAVKHLLKGTGVTLSLEAPKRLEGRKSDLAEAINKAATKTDTARLDRIEGYLSTIKDNTKPLATVREYEDRTEIKEGNRTRIIRKK